MSRILFHRSLTFRLQSSHSFSTVAVCRATFQPTPSPPRLPQKEQEEFERLQKSSSGAFSSSRSPTSSPSTTSTSSQTPGALSLSQQVKIEILKEQALHPDARAKLNPEFEGERNPRTGESGGPKQDPLRWGSREGKGDWSYGGRVTDF